MLKTGEAFWYPGTGPSHRSSTPHICVVAKIDSANDDIYFIPISSEILNLDQTCVINVADGWNPPIIRKSFAAYFHARRASLKGVTAQIAEGTARRIGVVPNEIFARIVAGITVSEDTEPSFKKAFEPKQQERRILSGD